MRRGRGRGTATVLFTDLVASTDLLSTLGDSAYDALRASHFTALRDAVRRFDGAEVKSLGDGILCTFGSAADAVGCAAAMQQAVDRHSSAAGVPLAMRVGLALGDVTFDDDDVFGAAVVEAARVVAAATGGQILATAVVRAAVGAGPHTFHELGSSRLKGLPDPVQLYEVAWAPVPVDVLLAEGRAAFDRGDGEASRRAFEAALVAQETGEALEGLARALYLEVDYPGSMSLHERAYRAYRDEGDAQGAARAARMLAWLHGALYGDWAVGNGWLGRACTFLEEAGDDSGERGWVDLTRAMSERDPGRRMALYRSANEIGRRFGDPNLEFEALGWVGMELVMTGRVEDGMRLLDEALAGVCSGEVSDLYVIEGTFCSMFAACERTNDVSRAEQWIRAADGVVKSRSLVAIGAYCRAHYGGILTAAGRWEEAEAHLEEAARVFARGHPSMMGNVLVRLADLRIRQGRLEEADQLLAGAGHHPDATRPRAALHLARGETALALESIERALSDRPGDAATDVPLLGLLVDVHLAAGETDRASEVAGRLSELAERSPGDYVSAAAALARGKLCLASGSEDARSCLLRALEGFEAAQMPVEAARVRLELARAAAADRPEVAVAEARAALAVFERLEAARDADLAAALLRFLGAPGPAGPRRRAVLTKRETEVLELLGHGLANAEIAARLFISSKTVEHHVGRILSKLGLRNRAEAAAHAVRVQAGRIGG